MIDYIMFFACVYGSVGIVYLLGFSYYISRDEYLRKKMDELIVEMNRD